METYLVAKGRMYRDGKPFYLSDHYGIVGLCDVAAVYAKDADSGLASERRKTVGERRKADAEAESHFLMKRRQAFLEEAALMQKRGEDALRAERLAEGRKLRGRGADQQQEAYKAAFVDVGSLWHPRRAAQFPAAGPPVADVALPGVVRPQELVPVVYTPLLDVVCGLQQRFFVGVFQA